jgi:hypothetical protein
MKNPAYTAVRHERLNREFFRDQDFAVHFEAARHQRFRHSPAHPGAKSRCGRQGPSCRRRLLLHHPAGCALLRRLHSAGHRRPHASRAGYLYLEQGACGCGAGLYLCRTRLFRSQDAEELALVCQHSEWTSGPNIARGAHCHRADGLVWRRVLPPPATAARGSIPIA